MATEAGGTQRLEAIVLAAGTGSRFGGGKLLARYGDGLLLHAALAAAFAAPVESVTVVIGADAEAVAAAARNWAEAQGQGRRLRVLHAADHAEGMGASLRAAVAALPPETSGVFVFLGDMPRVPHDLAARLLAAWSGAEAAAPVCGGRRGNPVLLGRALFPRLLELSGDQGARAVLQGLGERLALVPVEDDGVLFDVDAPEDLARG